MKSPAFPLLAAATLTLAACQSSDEVVSPGDEATATATPPPPSTPGLPAPLVPSAEAGEEGARNILLGFARALENGQFSVAWALLGETARADGTEAEFTAQWSDLTGVSVAILNGDMEGAAGSLFYTSQLTITAQDAEGRPLRFEGPIVLRRVNDVPGATEVQLRWHIVQLDLVQTH